MKYRLLELGRQILLHAHRYELRVHANLIVYLQRNPPKEDLQMIYST